jgi:hypothetical protein
MKSLGKDATGREETEILIFALKFYITKTMAFKFVKIFYIPRFTFSNRLTIFVQCTALQNFILVEISDYLLRFMR